jgi:ferric-dicitrate binding protein FerR (iron transport regulator)
VSASCTQAQAYLDRALPAAEAAQLEAHAAGCAECRKLIDSWEKFQEAYRTGTQRLLSEPTQADAGRLLHRALGGRPVTRRPLRWAWVGAGALAAAAVIALFVVSRRGPLPETPAYAVDAAGHRTSVSGGALEAGTERPATFALGLDVLGLAAGSRVELAARDSRRVRIELKRGSVAAAVHHREKGQSFEVHVGGATVSVVGTRFRVSAWPEGFGVDVAEGHVRVEQDGRTYDVLGGQSLRAAKGDVRTAPSSVDDFPELHPERSSAEPDAGASLEAPDGGAPAEPTHEHLVPASRIAAWRHAIVAGDAVSVIDEARRAARESPRQAELWEVLADAYRHGGSNAEAAHAYERAIALENPEQADHSRILLASLWIDRLNDPAHAEPVLRAYLRRAHGIVPDAQARVSLAKALRALGREAEARRELERVVRQYSAAPAAVEAHDLLKK